MNLCFCRGMMPKKIWHHHRDSLFATCFVLAAHTTVGMVSTCVAHFLVVVDPEQLAHVAVPTYWMEPLSFSKWDVAEWHIQAVNEQLMNMQKLFKEVTPVGPQKDHFTSFKISIWKAPTIPLLYFYKKKKTQFSLLCTYKQLWPFLYCRSFFLFILV